MNRVLALLALALSAFAGCGGEATSPVASLPDPRPEPPTGPDPNAVPVGFGGVLPPRGTALTLDPGSDFVVPVMADGDLGEYLTRPDWTGIPLRVVTDAPAEVLSVPAGLTVEGGREPDLLTIRALAPEPPAAGAASYAVRLEPPVGGFPELFGLSLRLEPDVVRVRVADPAPREAPDCDGLSFTAGSVRSGDGGATGRNWFGDLGSEFRSSELTLRSPDGPTELRLLSDYQQLPYGDFGDAYNLVPVMFAFGLDLRETTAGFEQTLSLAWFDELRLRAALPGCPPIELHCRDRGRCQTR